MKKIALLFALMLSGANLMAQKTTETVYLKNGSVIRGEVIEQVPGQSLKVQTKDGSIFVYQMDEVERIAKEQNSGASDGKYDHGHKGLDFSVEGMVNFSRGYAAGGGGFEVGKRFSPNFYWGVGVYVTGKKEMDVGIPVFSTLKALFPVTASGIAPNVMFRGGYTANAGGGFINLMPGLQIPLSSKIDFNLNMGYSLGIREGGVGHSGVITAGFGFHKPYDRSGIPIVPTRDRGVQLTLEASPTYGGSVVTAGGDFVLGYKLNPNISFGVGYGCSFIKIPRGGIEVSHYSDEEWKDLSGKDSYEEAGIGADRGKMHKIFLRGQYRLNDNRFSPIAALDFGIRKYTYHHDDEAWFFGRYDIFNPSWFRISGNLVDTEEAKIRKTSVFVTPAVGFSLRTTNNSYFEMKVGYEITGKQKGVKDYYANSYYRNSSSHIAEYKSRGLSGLYVSLGWTHTFSLFGGK